MTDPSTLESRAEQLKLARTLGVEPAELDFLIAAPAEDLRVLRTRIADHLFERDRRHFEGMIKLARKLPAGLSAQVAQHALGPVLGAKAAALLEPAMAVDLVRRLPPAYLADVAAAADVGRLAHLMADMPPEKIGLVGVELAAREEWIPMGAFVSHLSAEALDAAIGALDSEALLRTGFVMEDKTRLDGVVARLDDEQLLDYLRTALERNLLPEMLDLGQHLSAKGRKRLGRTLDKLSDAELERFAKRIRGEQVLRDAAERVLDGAPDRVRAAL